MWKKVTKRDIIEVTISTINDWIEYKLSSYVYFVVFTLIENGININIEKDVDNLTIDLEVELLSLGVERHLIRKIINNYKNIDNIKSLI